VTAAAPFAILSGAPEEGARAMARDESLVRYLARSGRPEIVLRRHGWHHPTLTLGRGQELPPGLQEEARDAGIELVRRPTGGGWLLHLPGDLAVTLALAGPLRAGDFRRAARMTSQALALGFAAAGKPALVFTGLAHAASRAEICFQRADRDEILIGSTKVAGVALARFGLAALVQAALPLVAAPAELSAFAARWDPMRAEAAAESLEIDRELLWRGTFEALGRLAERPGVGWHWPAPALRHAEELRVTVYADPARRTAAAGTR